MAKQIHAVESSVERLGDLCSMPSYLPLYSTAATSFAQNVAFDLTVLEIVHEEQLAI